MAKMTPGNRLYLYRLLSKEIGIGKQAPLTQVEEILLTDGIDVTELDYEDVHQLMEELDDFVRLTVFKKGRVYATIVRQELYEGILSRLEEQEPAETGGGKASSKGGSAGKGGAKAWKHKKSNKDPKPAKPRPKVRKKKAKAAAAKVETEAEAGAVQQAEATAETTAVNVTASEAAEAVTAETTEAKTAEAKEPTTEAPIAGAQTPAEEPAIEPTPEAPVEPQTAETEKAESIAHPSFYQGLLDQIKAQTPEEDELDWMDDEAASPTAEAQAQAAELVEPQAEPETQQTAVAAEAKSAPTDESSAKSTPEPAAKEEEATTPQTSEPQPAVATAAAATSEPATAAPVADESQQGSADGSASEPKPAHAPAPAPVPAPKSAAKVTGAAAGLQYDFPQDFSTEVYCKNEPLSLLYQLLPFDAEPMATLNEDWRYARSTGAFEGTRSCISFPLRYKTPTGDASLRVNLRRSAKGQGGKHWIMESVEVIDDESSEACSPEDVAQSIASAPLEPTVPIEPPADVARPTLAIDAKPDSLDELEHRLAHLYVIGSWEDYLSELAELAEDEDWSGRGDNENQDGSKDYEVLRSYMAMTVHNVATQLRLQVSEDRQAASFDTGLLSKKGQHIYDLLVPNKGDISWQHAGFCVAGGEELGQILSTSFHVMPQAAQYLTSPDEVMVATDAEFVLSPELEENLVQSLGEPEMQAALQAVETRTKTSYRTITPCFDPAQDRVCVLAPFQAHTLEGEDVDCALEMTVVHEEDLTSYRGIALLSLERAYRYARVISSDLPSWLK